MYCPSVDESLHDKIGEFLISNERLKALTGFKWDKIFELQNLLENMRNSINRNII